MGVPFFSLTSTLTGMVIDGWKASGRTNWFHHISFVLMDFHQWVCRTTSLSDVLRRTPMLPCGPCWQPFWTNALPFSCFQKCVHNHIRTNERDWIEPLYGLSCRLPWNGALPTRVDGPHETLTPDGNGQRDHLALRPPRNVCVTVRNQRWKKIGKKIGQKK